MTNLQNRRTTALADGVREAVKQASVVKNGGALAAFSDAVSFRKSVFQTGLFEVDVNLRPMFGSRIQLLGEAHKGKSLLSYIMMGAAHRTCRQCLTPIIDFVNDWTGEVATTCKCGACDSMRVLLLDSENSFDPAWANVWGVNVDPNFDENDRSQAEEIMENVYLTPDSTFVLIRGADSDQARIIVENMVRSGSVDLVVVDSLANLVPHSRREGNMMIGDHAKAISQFVTGVVGAQGEAANLDGVAPTLLMINQYRVKIGGFSPSGNPVQAAGGKALEYNNSISWDLRTKYNDGKFDPKDPVYRFGDSVLTAKKDKESGATGSKAAYRFYTNPLTYKGVDYDAGHTDEGSKIFSFLKELGKLDSRWFEKKGNKYVIFGREFQRVSDIAHFLGRRDVGHLLRFPIYAQKYPLTLRQHLRPENYNYSPFGDDPILEMYEEAEKSTGRNVRAVRSGPQPVMLGKGPKGKAKAKSAGSDDSEELLATEREEPAAGSGDGSEAGDVDGA